MCLGRAGIIDLLAANTEDLPQSDRSLALEIAFERPESFDLYCRTHTPLQLIRNTLWIVHTKLTTSDEAAGDTQLSNNALTVSQFSGGALILLSHVTMEPRLGDTPFALYCFRGDLQNVGCFLYG